MSLKQVLLLALHLMFEKERPRTPENSLSSVGMRVILRWSMTLYRANTPSTIGASWSPTLVGQRTFWFAVISTSSKPSSSSLTIDTSPSKDTFLLERGDVGGFLRSNEVRTKVDFPTTGAPNIASVTSCTSPAFAIGQQALRYLIRGMVSLHGHRFRSIVHARHFHSRLELITAPKRLDRILNSGSLSWSY